MGWAAEESTADLGDQRLNRRLIKVAQQLADKPTASIPAACGSWTDTAGAYRMLCNDRFDWRDVIEPHTQRTLQRMAQGRWCCACKTPRNWISMVKPSRVWGR